MTGGTTCKSLLQQRLQPGDESPVRSQPALSGVPNKDQDTKEHQAHRLQLAFVEYQSYLILAKNKSFPDNSSIPHLSQMWNIAR